MEKLPTTSDTPKLSSARGANYQLPTGLRSHFSKEGTLFLAGRTDSTNEILMAQIKPREIILHTEMAGSPFVNIKGSPKGEDLTEAAIMCARYSRDYKKSQGNVDVHYFLGKDTHKRKGMKTGTFGVRSAKTIIVKLKQIQEFIAHPAKKGKLMELQKQNRFADFVVRQQID